MKKLFASVALAALVAGSGLALADNNSGTGNSTLNFSLGYACFVNNASNPFTGTFDFSAAHIVNQYLHVIPEVSLGSVVGPTISVWCSGSGAVLGAKTKNGGITLGDVASAPSVPTIYYKAHIALGSLAFVDLPANGVAGFKVNTAIVGDIGVPTALTGTAMTLGDSGVPLHAGSYSDVLTIQIGDPL